MREFLEMGGYAFYVWSAYGLTFAALAGMLVLSLRDLRARERALKRFEEANPRRRRERAARKSDSGQRKVEA